MLSAKEIHFAINNQLTLNSSQTRSYESDELDDIINAKTIQLINSITSKEIKDRTDIEDSIIRGTKKTFYTIPIKENNEWSFDLPLDYLSTASAKATVYNTKCALKATKVVKNAVYRVKSNKAQYKDIWYKYCEVFVGDTEETFYGDLEKLDSTVKPAIGVDYKIYDITSIPYKPLYTIEGDKVKIKSKIPILDFYFTYFGQFNQADKIDYCNNKTLNFTENIQRYIIERVVLQLANIIEESQQKIANLKTEIE